VQKSKLKSIPATTEDNSEKYRRFAARSDMKDRTPSVQIIDERNKILMSLPYTPITVESANQSNNIVIGKHL
jgi:hypothetical protein